VENGDTVAEVALANHYATGAGVERNCAQARVLLEAAAKHGNEAAVKRLIQLRSTGCQ
jgi:TPR repeat protein